MEEKNKTGEFLKELRNEKGYTQEQLANKIHVTNKAISSWENGRSHPDPEMMKTLAKFYDVTVDELYAGTRRDTKEILFKRKMKRLCIRIVIFIFLVFFLLLLTYFILTVKSVEFYILDIDDNIINTTGGYYIVNSKNSILHLNKLELDSNLEDSTYIELYEKKAENNDILYSGFSKTITLENKIISNIDEVYLRVIYTRDEESKEQVYKIEFKPKYNNHHFIDLTSSSSSDFDNNSSDNTELVDKLLELNFEKQDEYLYFKEEKSKNEKTTTYVDVNFFSYNKIVENKDSKNLISYYHDIKTLDVQFLDSKNNIYKEFKYDIAMELLNCKIGRCNDFTDIESLKEDIEIVKLFK